LNIRRIATSMAVSLGMVAGLAATTGAASATTAASTTNHTTVFYQEGFAHGWAAVRPHIIYISGDGSFYVTNVDWSYMSVQHTLLQWWAQSSAQGFGTVNVNTCQPVDCADGHILHFAYSIVTLSGVRYHQGHPYFTRMELFYTPTRACGCGSPSGVITDFSLGAYGPRELLSYSTMIPAADTVMRRAS
jgi:hypothetical protein